MPGTISKWFYETKNNEVHLIAGEKGINNRFDSAHIVEKPELAEFLQGQEIVFLTGVAIESTNELIDLIENCCKYKASAIVINTGSYINLIPNQAIRFCDENHLPLFTVPWHVKIEQLMQTAFRLIFQTGNESTKLELLFENAITFPDDQQKYVPGLKSAGFEPEWKYCAALIHVDYEKDFPDTDSINNKILSYIKGQLSNHGANAFAYITNKSILIVFANYSVDDIEDVVMKLSREILVSMNPHGTLHYSVGRSTKSIRCLQKSYSLAQKIINLKISGQLPDSIHSYNKLGIYKIVIALENQDILNQIHDEYLAPLVEFDKACGTDYVSFISDYLKYDGKVKLMTEKMFIHRNTILYKIHKIEEILDCDLHRTDTQMFLMIAITKYNYVKK